MTWKVSQTIISLDDRRRSSERQRADKRRPADRSPNDILDWVGRDPELVATCSAAVDPLEVAAWLETRGLSRQVASDSFGYPDVFSAGDVVYRNLPFTTVEPPDPPAQLMGGPMDLLRGALYVLPALFLTIVVRGFSYHPSWWVLPIGLTLAWAISQAIAVLAWAERGRGEERGDGLLAFASIVVSAAASLGVAALAAETLGGNLASILEAVGVATYIAAAGILLLRSAEWVLLACVTPAAVAACAVGGFLPFTLTDRQGAYVVLGSLALVVLAAVGQLSKDAWRVPSVDWSDGSRASRYLLYGLGSGLLISVFIGFSDEMGSNSVALLVAIWPLMLTLGLMEWQVRSFRGRTTRAMTTSPDLSDFARRARRSLVRSTATFVTALVVLSAAGVVIGHNRGAANVPLLVGSIGAVGIAFFLALLLVASAQIDQVLVCWGITFGVLGASLGVVALVDGNISPISGIASLLVAGGVAVVVLSTQAWRVLASPIIY
jgi:hypothetical protein